MKKIALSILAMMQLCSILASGSVEGVEDEKPIELITYNIRLNTPSDGENAWPNRRADVSLLFRFHRADVFCVQEALPEQMDDLAGAFPDFSYEGVGRDDGKRAGEFSAVFYRADRFKRLDGGTFWLSETPGECSFGWDAVCRRVCSWVKLEDRLTGKAFLVMNTHFDHRGELARIESAKLILQKLGILSKGECPVVLCGDFNLPPDSEPVGLIKSRLHDAFELSKLPAYGSLATYHGFSYDQEPKERIDYVFVSDGVEVKRYGALTDSRDRRFFSDHLPVLVTLSF
ncbi:MAG: endonuclease [Bacteroidetes bacterium]|nr:MAG: endonuclease [Bacteroidota bacterium]